MKKLIIWAALLCLLLTGCAQAAPQEQLNSSAGTTTVPTTPASTTTVPTTVPTEAPTTAPNTAPTTAPKTQPTSSIVSTSATPSSTNKPPATLIIRDQAEYDALLLAAKQKDVFNTNSSYLCVFGTYENLTFFVKLLEMLPVPEIGGCSRTVLGYYPTADTLYVTRIIGETHFYRYTYWINQERAATKREYLTTQMQFLEKGQIINGDSRIKVLTQIKPTDERGIKYSCWMDIDGWLVEFETRNDNVDLSKMSIEEIFAPMTIEKSVQWS